jgi:ribosomal protein S12 methylthiotransferase accessory factor YcaO
VDNDDQPRFLARGSGYVHSAAVAIDRLEAVSEAEQARLTRRAHERREAQLQRAWNETEATINRALDLFTASAPPTLQSSIRAVRRSAAELGRKLGC